MTPDNIDKKYKELEIYNSFIKSSLPSTKSNIYFHVYDEVFQNLEIRK